VLGKLKAAGYTAIGRYYSKHTWKVLTPAEAKAIAAEGLQVFVVYEDSDDPTQITPANGALHAQLALAFAKGVQQPRGSAIYFAVDYEADAAVAAGPISAYFAAIKKTFADAGSPYRIGVYGDGVVCAYLLDHNLASLAWLSQSTGFPEHKQFKRWALAQDMPGSGISGIDGDPDELNPAIADFGGFQV